MAEKISRRSFLKSSISGASALALGGTGLISQISCSKRKPPNLIFVFPDQMRGQAIGFLGEEPVRTPVLDRFSKESMFFYTGSE